MLYSLIIGNIILILFAFCDSTKINPTILCYHNSPSMFIF